MTLPITCICTPLNNGANHDLVIATNDNRIIVLSHQQGQRNMMKATNKEEENSTMLFQVNGETFSVFENGSIITDMCYATGSGGSASYILASSSDNTSKIVSLGDKKVAGVLEKDGHTKPVTSCCISPDNRLILTAGEDEKLHLWNVLGEKKYTFPDTPKSNIYNNTTIITTCVRFVSSATIEKDKIAPLFARGLSNGQIEFFNGNLRTCFMLNGNIKKANACGAVTNLAFLKNSNDDPTTNASVQEESMSIVASAHSNGFVNIWDGTNAQTAQLLNRLPNLNDTPRQVLFSSASADISGGNDGMLIIVCDTKVVFYNLGPLLCGSALSEKENKEDSSKGNKEEEDDQNWTTENDQHTFSGNDLQEQDQNGFLEPTTTELPLYVLKNRNSSSDSTFVKAAISATNSSRMYLATNDGKIMLVKLDTIADGTQEKEDESLIWWELVLNMSYDGVVIDK